MFAENLGLIPSTHVKSCTQAYHPSEFWKVEAGSLGFVGQSSLAESVSSRFKESPCLKNGGGEKDRKIPDSTPDYVCTYTYKRILSLNEIRS